MGGVLDGQPGVVGAVMVGQLGLSVEDADAGGAGDQGQRLSDVGVGNRVEIAVEADVGSLAGADDAHQVGLEGMGGQRQQAGLFFGPDVGDTAVGLVGVTPPVGDLVSPAAELGVENRLVADNLERHWNEALQRLAAAEEAYAGADKTRTPPVTPEMKERVAALVADLPRVWHDPRTPARDRKRMLRLLIEDVTLLRDDVIRVSIRWRGGATRRIECPLPLAAPDLRRTPAAVVEQVRALATEQTDAQIADTLNGRWLRTGTGLPFSRPRVRMLREAYDIDSYAEHLIGARWLTVPQMAALLDVHPATAKRFAHQGVLRAVRADDKGTLLFEPPTGPLPVAHPGKRLRDRSRYPKLVSHVQEGA